MGVDLTILSLNFLDFITKENQTKNFSIVIKCIDWFILIWISNKQFMSNFLLVSIKIISSRTDLHYAYKCIFLMIYKNQNWKKKKNLTEWYILHNMSFQRINSHVIFQITCSPSKYSTSALWFDWSPTISQWSPFLYKNLS